MTADNPNFLASTHNLTGVGGVQSLRFTYQDHLVVAQNSGLDGLEVAPTRRIQHQILSGILTDEEISVAKAGGQSFRSERYVTGMLSAILKDPVRAKLYLGAFLMYPHITASNASLRVLQNRSPEIPILLQDSHQLKGTQGLKNRVLIVTPDSFEDLGVTKVRDIAPRAEKIGFDGGLCLDPFQLRRPNKDGEFSLLADWQRTIPGLWNEARIVHLSLGRDDLRSGVDLHMELVDMSTPRSDTEIGGIVRLLGEQYQRTSNHPDIVFQIPYSGVARLLGKTVVTRPDVESVASKVLQNTKIMMGL